MDDYEKFLKETAELHGDEVAKLHAELGRAVYEQRVRDRERYREMVEETFAFEHHARLNGYLGFPPLP